MILSPNLEFKLVALVFKMSLSLDKLHRLLIEKGFAPVTHFYYQDLCRYIEIVSSESAEHFLLTISSRYDIGAKDSENGYTIKYLEVDSNGRIPEKYATLPDNIEMSQMYDEIDLARSQGVDESEDIESKLLDGYKRNIPLSNSSDGNISDLKDIFNQLKRISNCFSGLQYRAAIFHKVWLSVLTSDNEIECYYIKNYSPSETRKFLITIDLENFLQNYAKVASDVDQINQGISRILDKNISSHTRHLYAAMQNIPTLASIIQKVQVKRNNYASLLAEFSNLLEIGKIKEKELKAQLDSIMLARNGDGRNIYGDMDRARLKSGIDREMEKVVRARTEVLDSIMKIKTRDRNLVLVADKILFENVVMLNSVNKNLHFLNNLCK